ncbi:MAG: Rrf2 family transcriptional regulator [Bacteroidetes bacterium]|nr:Rrf2 family transcriptional regulator [Bacteroidota bacterium]
MTASSRFPAATHILTALHWNEGQLLSSEQLAVTVNTNPVVIRRVLGTLRKAGLVTTLSGAHGGSKLARSPQQITLLEVYRAVEDTSLFRLHCPNTTCALGGVIETTLAPIYGEAEQAMEQVLAGVTLAQVSHDARTQAGVEMEG